MLRDGKGNLISYSTYSGGSDSDVEYFGISPKPAEFTITDPWCSINQLQPFHTQSTELACQHITKDYKNKLLLLTDPPQVQWECENCGEYGFN